MLKWNTSRVIKRAGQSAGAGVVSSGSPYVGPLDLVSGAFAAYSVRALSSAFLGQPIFKLRRDSDDAELDFSADATTGEAPVADITTWLGGADAFVTTWYDQSGNDLDLTQATAGQQPELGLSSGSNSRPELIFLTANSCALAHSAQNLPNAEYSYFAVVKRLAELPFQPLILVFDDDSFTNYAGIYINSQSRLVTEAYSEDGVNAAGAGSAVLSGLDSYNLFDGSWKQSAWAALQNGGALSEASNFDSGDPPVNINKPFFVAGSADYGYSSLSTSEIIFYNSEKDNSARLSGRQNIATFYGITLS